MHDRFEFSCRVAVVDRLLLTRQLRKLSVERNAYLRAAADLEAS